MFQPASRSGTMAGVSQLASRRSSPSKLGTLDEDSTIKTVTGFAVFCLLASSPVAGAYDYPLQ